MTKINVIGGSGFIGSCLVNALNNTDNLSVSIIDKSESLLFPDLTKIADVRNLNDLESAIDNNSIIINLAAEHRDDVYPKSLYYDVNVNGAINICNIARKKNINKIIFTSSVAVYGFSDKSVDESGNIQPFNDYGKSKHDAELIFKDWQLESPLNRSLIIIRPTVVFGENNRGNVYNLFNQIFNKRFIMLGNGNNRKSIAYVENVASFIKYSIFFEPGIHLYNYVDKPDLTMSQLVDYVKNILGHNRNCKFSMPLFLGLLIAYIFDFVAFFTHKKFSISAIRVKKFCSDSIYNSSVISTGFIPPFSLFDGLERTINYDFKQGELHNQNLNN
jgi:nucleoside-diphosphate-sugar epimerase